MIRHHQVKQYHRKPENFKHVETIKVSEKTYTGYIIGKVLTWRSQLLIITIIRQPQVKPYHLKPQTLKHVEIINFQIKLHMIFQWKGFDLEISSLNCHLDQTPSVETIPSQTSKP